MEEQTDIIEAAVLAGRILMQSGAETSRVEETMQRLLSRHFSPDCFGVYATPTGLFATVELPGKTSRTKIQDVRSRGINLAAIDAVNTLSRQFSAGEISLNNLQKDLIQIAHTSLSYYPFWQMILFCAAASLFFCFLFFGSLFSAGVSFAIGAILGIYLYNRKFTLKSTFLNNLVGSFLVALLAGALALLGLYSPEQRDIIIISCLMPMVPGVAFTGAIRDIVGGDYISGAARILEVILIAVSLAIGSVCALSFLAILTGGIL